MRESVIYQEILEEGEAKGIAKGKAEGKAEGEAEGEAKGKAETARKVALNLLGIGMSLEQVAQVTELSIEQVRVLQQEII